MSDLAIRVENLSKQYTIGTARYRHDMLRDMLMDGLRGVLRRNGRPDRREHAFWALKDVSFEVKRGDVIGIIGPNGAGKSTLLKILSRITEPTAGRAEIYGRVGSLLEVGTGFDRELTGRENVYLNGAIIGMKKAEIDRKFDEIVAFAEVEKFIDTPVKRYSSGMYVRLAFAVAAHLELEIMIIDEVLAVGDLAFQKKCLGVMRDVGKQGRTVLFVSHNMSTVSEICQEALLLQDGSIISHGSTRDIVAQYIGSSGTPAIGQLDVTGPQFRRNAYTSPTSRFKWTRISLLNSEGQLTPEVSFGEPFQLQFEGIAQEPISGFRAGFGVHSANGIVMFNSWHTDQGLPTCLPVGSACFRVVFDPNYLAPGAYHVDVGIYGSNVQDLVSPFRFFVLPVSFDRKRVWHKDRHGVLDSPCKWILDGAE